MADGAALPALTQNKHRMCLSASGLLLELCALPSPVCRIAGTPRCLCPRLQPLILDAVTQGCLKLKGMSSWDVELCC